MSLGLHLGLTVGNPALSAGGGVAVRALQRVSWDRSAYPLTLSENEGSWQSSFDRDVYLPDSSLLTTYYVDVATGNDSNSGLTSGLKLKSIHAAVTKGNATGSPYRVLVTAGRYPRANGLNNTGTIQPTQNAAIVAVGGRVVTGPFDDLSWPASPDPTYTNCYKVSRSNVARVFDIATLDAHGNYTELVNVADAVTCDSTPGSFAQVGSDLYVRRVDGAAVTNANTRAHLIQRHLNLTSGFNGKRLYLENIDLEGGVQLGTLSVDGVTDTVIMAQGCSFKYSGGYSGPSYVNDNVALWNSSGLFAFVDCEVGSAWKDGFNAHWQTDSERRTYVLTERCRGRDFGRGSSTSNNAITGHETVVWVDVEGDWSDGRGGTVRFIDTSTLAAFGSSAANDLGDGVESKIAWHALHNVVYALVDCQGAVVNPATDYALAINNSAVVYGRDFEAVSGLIFGTIQSL